MPGNNKNSRNVLELATDNDSISSLPHEQKHFSLLHSKT
jgi:hypothetical protein